MSSTDLKNSEVSDKLVPIIVKDILGKEVAYNVYLRTHTVNNLKALIQECEGIPTSQIVLFYINFFIFIIKATYC
jgi:hypothetical protein